MYEEIGQISYPDARKQTFCYTGSRQTLFFFFLIIATCWGPPLLGFVEAVVPGDADVVLEGSGSDSSGKMLKIFSFSAVRVVVVVYSPCWSVDRSPLPGK